MLSGVLFIAPFFIWGQNLSTPIAITSTGDTLKYARVHGEKVEIGMFDTLSDDTLKSPILYEFIPVKRDTMDNNVSALVEHNGDTLEVLYPLPPLHFEEMGLKSRFLMQGEYFRHEIWLSDTQNPELFLTYKSGETFLGIRTYEIRLDRWDGADGEIRVHLSEEQSMFLGWGEAKVTRVY